MGDNEQNASNPVDDQETNEGQGLDERQVVQRRPDERGSAQSNVAAPAEDDIIIK